MNVPYYGDDQPIAAPATPLSESALTLIRTSGKNAPNLVAPFFSRPALLREAPGNTVIHGWIVDGEERLDEALVSVFRAPRSYTGEDALDISCHGGGAAARAVMGVLKKAGFRDALPGEFTFRAFMNGKLDLTRAESVMELVTAKTGQGRRGAVNRLSGSLEEEIRNIKAGLVTVLAAVELFLDYSEDEAGETPPDAAVFPERARVEEALTRLRGLAASYSRERLYHDGALVVIAGRPNAGKSSLFNVLLREDRSIVTDIPGATRDWVEGWIALEGIPVRLADTAGLHATDDPVERLSMERSRNLVRQSDLLLYILDGTAGLTPEDAALLREFSGVSRILVWNKADLAASDSVDREPPLRTSAKTGQGIGELSSRIAAALECGATERGAAERGAFRGGANETAGTSSRGIGTARQKELVDRAITSLEEALEMDPESALDLIAPLLREGVDALGEITGEVSTADILETMFSCFCVGK
ncbi:MAG: tRNA uridine-5-carboxymethylaminomethyl(34) synthesis GTPase MnmE [Treponema sp.]|jgi:tRNA modification GTPase|nr:tRNA uridine-5-carboxymethylaminomethyl(34) synthesis GTPase MnmE [Treponema sp.]